jgi:hypothetical protein
MKTFCGFTKPRKTSECIWELLAQSSRQVLVQPSLLPPWWEGIPPGVLEDTCSLAPASGYESPSAWCPPFPPSSSSPLAWSQIHVRLLGGKIFLVLYPKNLGTVSTWLPQQLTHTSFFHFSKLTFHTANILTSISSQLNSRYNILFMSVFPTTMPPSKWLMCFLSKWLLKLSL